MCLLPNIMQISATEPRESLAISAQHSWLGAETLEQP